MNKQEIIDTIAQEGLLLGQSLGAQSDYNQFITPLSHTPALLRIDLMTYDTRPSVAQTATNITLQHWLQDGIAYIDIGLPNPWLWPEISDRKDLTGRDLEAVVTPNTQCNSNLNEILSRYLPYFDQLADNNVIWIMRTLPELNYTQYTWYSLSSDYWNYPPTQANPDVKRVIAVHNYIQDFFRARYPNNIIWGYSPAAYAGTWIPLDILYPGTDRIDLVGVTRYSTTMTIPGNTQWVPVNNYQALLALGKPFVFWEWGASQTDAGSVPIMDVLEATTTQYPEAKMICFWHSWPNNPYALVEYADQDALLTHPQIVTLSKWTHAKTNQIIASLEAAITQIDILTTATTTTIHTQTAQIRTQLETLKNLNE